MDQFSLVRIDGTYQLNDLLQIFYKLPSATEYKNISEYFSKMYRPIFFIITSIQYHLSDLISPQNAEYANESIFRLSVAIHAQNTILAMVVVRLLMPKTLPWILACIFYYFSYTALVPVGRVAWQTDLINAYICLLSIAIVAYNENKDKLKNSILIAVLQIIAMLNKETFLSFPIVTFLYIYFLEENNLALKQVKIFYYSFIPLMAALGCLLVRSIILNAYSDSLYTNYIYEYIHGNDHFIAPLESYLNYFSLAKDFFHFASLEQPIELLGFIPHFIIIGIIMYSLKVVENQRTTIFLICAGIPGVGWVSHNMDSKYHHVYIFMSIALIFNTAAHFYSRLSKRVLLESCFFVVLVIYIVYCFGSNIINFYNSDFELKDLGKHHYNVMNN